MGISHSTAKWLAPTSFLFDFALQQYGMFSSPNMKDVNDANISFWSPHPFSIAGFFAPQQVFQLIWLYRLYKSNPSDPSLSPAASKAATKDLDTMTHYVPYYALGNVCIGTWMFFWNSSQLKLANIFVVINSLSQLFYITTQQPAMQLYTPQGTRNWTSILTHFVSKTFAGIGVLDLLHNGSVAYFNHQGPNLTVKVITALGFGLASSMSDWIFGGCMVYDLLGLAVGQYSAGNTSWAGLLGVYAVGAAAIVGGKNLAR